MDWESSREFTKPICNWTEKQLYDRSYTQLQWL